MTTSVKCLLNIYNRMRLFPAKRPNAQISLFFLQSFKVETEIVNSISLTFIRSTLNTLIGGSRSICYEYQMTLTL